MLATGLLLLAVQASAGTAAAEARAALIDSEARLQVMEMCGGRTGLRNRTGAALRRRHTTLRAEASVLLPFIEPGTGDVLSNHCPGNAGERRRLAADAVDRFAAAVARRRAAMRGLWFGPLHLCSGTVLTVSEAWDEQDQRAIHIRFAPSMAAALATETMARVRTQLPLILDGRTVVAPIVNEPILGGVVSLAGGEPLAGVEGGVDALRAAAARPCAD